MKRLMRENIGKFLTFSVNGIVNPDMYWLVASLFNAAVGMRAAGFSQRGADLLIQDEHDIEKLADILEGLKNRFGVGVAIEFTERSKLQSRAAP